MHLSNHHIELSKLLHDKMSKIYIFQAILVFVKGLIGVFVPVYLYKLGYSIIEVILYTNLILVMYILLIPLSVKLIKKIGFKYTILLSVPVYILHIISLNFLSSGYLFYHLSWITFGVYMAIFWPAMHSEITLNGSSKHRGSQIGTLQVISTIFATLAPIIGGFFLEYLKFYHLLFLSIFFLFIALLPLLLANDIEISDYNFSYRDFFRLFLSENNSASKKAFMAEGIDILLSANLWPVILFILLQKDFLNFGLLYGFVSFLSVVFIVYFKEYIDAKKKEDVLGMTTHFMSINWFFRSIIFFFGSIFLYFIESFAKLVYSVYYLSYSSIFYNNAKLGNYLEYIILREMYILIGKMMVSSIFIGILFFYGESINVLFTLIIIGIVVPVGLTYLKEEV